MALKHFKGMECLTLPTAVLTVQERFCCKPAKSEPLLTSYVWVCNRQERTGPTWCCLTAQAACQQKDSPMPISTLCTACILSPYCSLLAMATGKYYYEWRDSKTHTPYHWSGKLLNLLKNKPERWGENSFTNRLDFWWVEVSNSHMSALHIWGMLV